MRRWVATPVTWALSAWGLPTVPGDPVSPATARAYETFTRERVDGSAAVTPIEPPGEPLPYLRWLAANRPVLFHGSGRAGLTELRTDRETGDSTDFGSQQAVFASDDPLWTMYFALLRRPPELTSTRNGSWSAVGATKRFYFFSVNAGVPEEAVLGPGWLYVLPRQQFVVQPPAFGVLHSAQWVSPQPVRPLACVAVEPADFPFAGRIGRHRPDESMWRTAWDARRR